MQIVLLGLAGAGKGTQGQLLSKRLKLAHVASGDIFRNNQTQATELGLVAKNYMDRGELVPDDITIQMILKRIRDADCAQGFILDGFPRTLPQAAALDQALKIEGISRAIYINVSEKELIRRLSGRLTCRECGHSHQRDAITSGSVRCPGCSGELYQRPDDKPEVVRHRLQMQNTELTKLLDYYSGQGKLIDINGEQNVDDVTTVTLAVMSELAPIG